MERSSSTSSSLGVPARKRSGTVGSWRSGRSEEFGKHGTSSKNSSVTSSFKSFASSFLPGRSHKPVSAPAPVPATVPELEPEPSLTPPRESTPTPPRTPDQGPTTIRLIPSPGPNALLPRSKSAADLLEGVPLATPMLNKIAAELAAAEDILKEEEAAGARVSFGFSAAGYDDDDADVGDVSMASIGLPATAPTTVPVPELEELDDPTKPFVFGHPRHSVSNTQFGDAAAAVLREMNARMGITSPGQAVSIEQLQGVMASAGKPTAPLRVEKKSDVRFKTTHDKEFAKMDSIANHYSVREKKRKSEHGAASKAVTDDTADKIFTLPPHLAAANEAERTTKRARISTADGTEPPDTNKALVDSSAVRAQLEKRRRSSAARKSGVGARRSGAGPAPSKGGFGFMKMVRGIWGSKPKELEKPKLDAVKKHVEVVRKTDDKPEARKLPDDPTHQPLVLPSVPKTKIEEKKPIGLGRPSGVVPKAGRVASEGAASTTGTIGKSRAGSSLYAPTAASLARQGVAVKPTTTTATATKTSTVRSRAATTGTPADAKPLASRPLPVPPTTVGRATTASAATQGSRRMTSPPTRAATTAGARKSVATRSPTGVVRSPTGPRKSIFTSPLTVDAMTMRGSAPTVQPFRLSPQGNLNPDPTPTEAVSKSAPTIPNASGTTSPSARPTRPAISAKTGTTALKPPVTRPARRPRISRSKVIARLGEKRAAAASVSSPSNKALSPTGKARSSLQVRRSVGGVAAKRALEADRIRARRSEAATRRTRLEDRGLVGRRSEGSVLKRR